MNIRLLGILKTIILVLTILISNNLYAKTIYYTGQEITVKITPQKMTEISFKGDKIASIVMGFSADTISLQNAGGNLLYVQPLIQLNGHFFVVTESGQSVMFTLVTVPEEMMDKKIDLVFTDKTEQQRIANLYERNITPAGLIKIMITKNVPEDIVVSKKAVNLGEGLVADEVYDAGYMKGYTGKISDPNFDIRNLNTKGLIAGTIINNKFYLILYSVNLGGGK